jgi:hypothetical protein
MFVHEFLDGMLFRVCNTSLRNYRPRNNISFNILISNFTRVSRSFSLALQMIFPYILSCHCLWDIDKNTRLILDMVQWIMDFPVIENEKFCATNLVQYDTLLSYSYDALTKPRL